MALVVRARSFHAGWNRAPVYVRRALLRVLTEMAEMSVPGPVDFDASITLFIPVPVTVTEHELPNTGWSLLYLWNEEAITLRFLCETPPR